MIDYHDATGRFLTRAEGRTTWHSFSFGAHYDSGNTGFGPLVAHNDERLSPGSGYDDHSHAETEIVTWVLTGSLRHTSSVGEGTIGPGQVQRLSAGSGVVHAEVNGGGEETRFLQVWLRPDEAGTTPDYRSAEVDVKEHWTVVAGDGGIVPIGTSGAALHVAAPVAGRPLELPDARRLHVFVAGGAVMLGERRLEDGDAARLTDEGGRDLRVEADAQVLVWAFTSPRSL